jgi:carboxymethylenebutenolidase
MKTLTRPEGTEPEDLSLSRRGLAGAVFGGYAVFAFSAQAAPITTDDAGLTTETVQVPTPDRAIPAFVARPNAKGRFPVVMVIPEVFGLHEYIRDVCRRLAKLGYVAISPDLFVRQGDPSKVSDFAEIRRIVGGASEAQVMGDLEATLAFLKKQPYADRSKIATTGFCWGGAVVWLASARFKEIKAGVAWYGRLSAPKPGEFLGDPGRNWPIQIAGQTRAPVLGLYAGKDAGIPLTDVEAMKQALAAGKKTKSDIVVYPESQHGFHADYRASYDATAAADGWSRMLAFFAANGVKPKAFKPAA